MSLNHEEIDALVAEAEKVAAERDREHEHVARRFHEAYEQLAPSYGYKTRRGPSPWKAVPANNRSLMIAVVARLIEEGIIEIPDATLP